MTEKELLYLSDAVNHEIYMVQTCDEVSDCLQDKNLIKFVKKMKKKHESLLEMIINLL